MPSSSPPIARPAIRVYAAALACLPLPAFASDFTGMFTGFSMLLVAAALVVLAPLLLLRRRAWVRSVGGVMGGGVLLIGVVAFCLDTWRVIARITADRADVVPWLLLYLLLWLALGYVLYRLLRKPLPVRGDERQAR